MKKKLSSCFLFILSALMSFGCSKSTDLVIHQIQKMWIEQSYFHVAVGIETPKKSFGNIYFKVFYGISEKAINLPDELRKEYDEQHKLSILIKSSSSCLENGEHYKNKNEDEYELENMISDDTNLFVTKTVANGFFSEVEFKYNRSFIYQLFLPKMPKCSGRILFVLLDNQIYRSVYIYLSFSKVNDKNSISKVVT